MIAPFATLLQTLVHRPGPCNPLFSVPATSCSVQFGCQNGLKLPFLLFFFCLTAKDAKMWPMRGFALHPQDALPTNMGFHLSLFTVRILPAGFLGAPPNGPPKCQRAHPVTAMHLPNPKNDHTGGMCRGTRGIWHGTHARRPMYNSQRGPGALLEYGKSPLALPVLCSVGAMQMYPGATPTPLKSRPLFPGATQGSLA